MPGTSLLITVGSTSFPALTDFITSPTTLATLRHDLAIDNVIVQHGSHPPSHQPRASTGAKLQAFAYTPSLHVLLSTATVVVSHAGAGTILEAVDLCKPLVVVVNSALMNDHQTELANAMAERHCCEVVTNADIDTKLIAAIAHVLSADQPAPQPASRVKGVFGAIVAQETGLAIAARCQRRPNS